MLQRWDRSRYSRRNGQSRHRHSKKDKKRLWEISVEMHIALLQPARCSACWYNFCQYPSAAKQNNQSYSTPNTAMHGPRAFGHPESERDWEKPLGLWEKILSGLTVKKKLKHYVLKHPRLYVYTAGMEEWAGCYVILHSQRKESCWVGSLDSVFVSLR